MQEMQFVPFYWLAVAAFDIDRHIDNRRIRRIYIMVNGMQLVRRVVHAALVACFRLDDNAQRALENDFRRRLVIGHDRVLAMRFTIEDAIQQMGLRVRVSGRTVADVLRHAAMAFQRMLQLEIRRADDDAAVAFFAGQIRLRPIKCRHHGFDLEMAGSSRFRNSGHEP